MDTSQAPHGFRKGAIRPRIILSPQRSAKPQVARKAPGSRIAVQRTGGIHEPGKDPLGFLLSTGNRLDIFVFDPGILAEWTLQSKQCPDEYKNGQNCPVKPRHGRNIAPQRAYHGLEITRAVQILRRSDSGSITMGARNSALQS